MTDETLGQLALFAQQNPQVLSGAGQFFVDMTGGIFADLIGIGGGDQLKIYRAEKCAERIHAARRRLEDKGIVPRPVSPSLGVPLLEAAASEENEELLDLWVELLAAAMDPSRSKLVRRSFIETVKAMDPYDALVLKALINRNPWQAKNICQMIGVQTDVAVVSVNNLLRLGLIATQADNINPSSLFSLTYLGISLRRALGLETALASGGT